MGLQDTLRRLSDDVRYWDADQKRKAVMLSALGLLVLATVIVLTLSTCRRTALIADARPEQDESLAIAQVRDAMFSVTSRLVGESKEATVQAAVHRAAEDKAKGIAPSCVDKSPLKFNPNLKHWVDPRQTAADTVLVVGAAPASFKARGVGLIGVGRGGIQIEIKPENTPDWVSNAVLGPAQ